MPLPTEDRLCRRDHRGYRALSHARRLRILCLGRTQKTDYTRSYVAALFILRHGDGSTWRIATIERFYASGVDGWIQCRVIRRSAPLTFRITETDAGKRDVLQERVYTLADAGGIKAFLIDTGAVADAKAMPLAKTVLELLPDKDDKKLPLLLARTHRHLDHRAGDPQFASLPSVQTAPNRFGGGPSVLRFHRLAQ
jgi:hypothetical protein